MASDDQSYSAGTAYLVVEPKLSGDFEADLATALAAIPAMPLELATPDMKAFGEDLDREWSQQGHKLAIDLDPQFGDDALAGIADRLEQAGPFHVALTADLDKFAQDLDQRWRNMAARHELPIEIAPAFDDKALSDQLPGYTRITGDLDLTRAEAQLEQFFSMIPVYRIPVELDTAVADAQLEEMRARALDPVYTPVGVPAPNPANESTPNRALEAMQREDRTEAARQTEINRQATREQWQTPSKESQAADAAAKKQADDAAKSAQKLRDEQDKAAQGMRDFRSASKEAADSAPFEALKDALGDIGNELEELGQKALKWGALGGLAGGALATLGAAGLAGALGAHGVMGAFQAEKAVSEEQRDPEAQLDRQAKIRAAADQVRTANEGLSEATFKVGDAQTAAKLSSMSLADAYKEVGRQVRDASDAFTDAQLAEEGAALGVAGARQHLMQDLMSGNADPLAIETDIFGVQSASQKFSESKKKTADQAVDSQEIQQRGVSGSPEIIQATQSNADAQHGVALALQGVRDAEISVTEAAADMHRALMPTEAENRLNIALGRLSPNARDFVNVVHTSVIPAFHDLSQTVSTNLFAELGESLNQAVQDQMPAMKSGFGQIATGLNGTLKDTFSELDSMFSKLEADGTMQKFIDGVDQALQGVAPLISGLTKGLIDLGAELGPHLGPLFKELGDFLGQLGKPLGELGGAIADALTKLGPSLSPLLDSLGTGLTELIKGLAPSLPTIATAFTDILNAVEPLIKPLADLGATILTTIATNMSSLAQALTPVISQFAEGLKPLIPTISDTLKDLTPVFKQMATTLSQALLQALEEILPKLPDLVTAFSNLFEKVAPLLPKFMDLATSVLPPVVDLFSHMAGPLSDLVGLFADWFGWVDKIADRIGDFFHTLNSSPFGRAGIASIPFVGPLIEEFSGHADGGYITGPGGPRDDKIPAMLSNGEYVINAQSTAQHRGTLEAINAGHYANGGYVSSSQQQTSTGHGEKEAVRQSRKRVLGLRDGGYVDDSGFTDADPQDIPGRQQNGSGDQLNEMAGDNSGTAPRSNEMALTPSPKATPATSLYPRSLNYSTTPGQGFPSSWQADGATGGPVNALNWAKTHSSTPYVWGGTAADGADCSGWVGDLQQVATGVSDPTARLGTTMDVLNGTWPSLIPGASKDDLFVIGASSEHMVASILGVNVEERQSGETARSGNNAASPWDSQFTTLGHIDPAAFVPAFNDPKQATSNQTGTGTSGTGGTGTGSDANDAIANQGLAVGMPVPDTWSGAAGAAIGRGLAQLWYGPDPAKVATDAANAKPGTMPALDDGLHGTLQSAFQSWINTAPKDQQAAWSKFLLGPNLAQDATPNAGGQTGNGQKDPAAALAGLGNGGGLLGIIGTGLLGGGKIKGLSQLLSEGAQFELQPLEKATGFNDSFQGSPAALWSAGNYLQEDQTAAQAQAAQKAKQQGKPNASQSTPTHGDPSTTGNKTTPSASGNAASASGTTQPKVDTLATQYGASSELVAAVQHVADGYGWGSGPEWNALDTLIGNESSWNPNAQNPGSTAYGLGQFLDQTWGTLGATKTSDPTTQAQLMDTYIAQRYGDPISALNFWEAQSPHWYADGGDVSGAGSSLSDSIPAMLSDGEFVVNAASTDRHRSLLHLINQDRAGTMAPVSTVPTRELLSSSAVTSHVDQSATYNVHAHDIDGSVKAMKLLEAQRAAKAGTYLGRWRNYRGI